MASAVDTSATFGAEVVDEILLIPTDQIEPGERLRALDPVWVHALGQIMLREGQNTPVEVCRLPGRKTWTVVAGGHRHAAARDAGIEYLRAIVVSADRADRRRREISENLWRRDLDPIDRAAFIAELVELRRAQAGLEEAARRDARVPLSLKKQVDAEAGEMLETISSIYGFTDEVGEQLGFSGRTIRNDLLIYRGIAPSLVERLREERHPVLGNASQLRALAKLEAKEQAEVVDRLLGHNKPLTEAVGGAPSPKTVSAALASIRGAKAADDPEAKRLSTFISTFQRMGLAEKKGALAHLAALLPANFKLVEEVSETAKPSRETSPGKAKGKQLDALVALIEEHRSQGIADDAVIAGLVSDHGARLRLDRDPFMLRLAGLAVTCTWSRDTGLLNAWIAAANRRLGAGGEK